MKRLRKMEVEVPITPMLDMAFQLLTFFILTYRPAPAEGAFSMNLLPAQPATQLDAQVTAEAAASNELPASLRTLDTGLSATPDGLLGRVTIGQNVVDGMDALERELTAILKDPLLPFDQALIRVDPRLSYAELMKVVDIYSRLKIVKISFAELAPFEGGLP